MPYGAAASKKRLETNGFHKQVSNYSPQGEFVKWVLVGGESLEYRKGRMPSFGRYIDADILIKVFDVTGFEDARVKNAILGIFSGLQPYGQVMGQELALTGIRNIENLAKAYPEGWAALSQGMAIWDTLAQAYKGTPSGSVFLAVTRKLSYGEFKNDVQLNQEWEVSARNNVINTIEAIYRECGPTVPYWRDGQQARDETLFEEAATTFHSILYGKQLVNMVRSLPTIQRLPGRISHLVDQAASEEYHMSMQVNANRANDQPRIQALDFYPRYNAGSVSKAGSKADSNTYGLSWCRLKNDISQRGLFGVLLQAVLKSRRMKIGILMDREAAFMTYLSKLPFIPLQIFSFLDGLYRYLDLMAAKSTDKNAIKQALYDVVKPVRMGLVPIGKDWPSYYCEQLGKNMMFCSSCGYEYLQEFFTAEGRRSRPQTRVCAACTLRIWLDDEEDHGKKHGQEIWEPFFPDWRPFCFNVDAPLHQHGEALLRLKSRDTVRPLPSLRVGPDGNLFRPRHEEHLVRDNKVHRDSVQNLPPLRAMFNRTTYRMAMYRARAIDARRTVAILLQGFYPPSTGKGVGFRDVIPDHYHENQGRARTGNSLGKESNTFETATIFFQDLETEGSGLCKPGKTDTFW
ncbi:hypothetical protein ACHAPT_000249 [Fusarium lateritium]